MRNLIIGFVAGSLLAATFACAGVNERVQQQIGQLIIANAQLQDQYETAIKKLADCEKEHTTHKKGWIE